MRFWILVSAVCMLCSCDTINDLLADKPAKLPPKPILTTGQAPMGVVPPALESSVPVAGVSDCRTLVESVGVDVKSLDEDNLPTFEITSDDGLSADAVVLRVSNIADAVYGKGDCVAPKLKFRASGREGAYFESVISRADYVLYKSGRISRAELTRRFELQQLETLVSVKLKLKQARADADDGYAAKLVDEWLDKEPDNATAQIIKANILLDKNRYQEAQTIYENSLLTQPMNFLLWFNLAFAKQQSGTYAEAEAIYRKLLENYAQYEFRVLPTEEIQLHLADALLSDGRLDEAQAALAAVTDQTNDTKMILDANLKRAQKNPADARKTLESYLKIHPESDVARFNLVLVCVDLKDKDCARKEYETLKAANTVMAEELKFMPIFSDGVVVSPPVEEKTQENIMEDLL